MERVVVTGLGTINPLGVDVEQTWAGARAGRCAISALEAPWVDEYGLAVRVAGQLPTPTSELLSAREVRRLDPATQCALIAARQAWAQAFGSTAQVEPERLAVSFSPGMGCVTTVMEAWDTLRTKGPRRVAPTTVPALMPNAPAATLAMEFTARAGAHAPVSACASGAEAVSYGADLIRLGRADVVVAGGCDDALHPLTVAAFAAMRALSTNPDPAGACRPFASDRDGFVLGQGAGSLVLEAESYAKARGAKILAYLDGSAVTCDAYDVARPMADGHCQEQALRQAIAQAGISPAQVGHVNAHATSTPAGDGVEAAMLARVVPQAAVSATKSMTGHLLGGAGGLEAVLTVLALAEQWAPPTLMPGELEAQTDIDVVGPQGRQLKTQAAASTSFGFGGHNVALVFTAA